MLYLQLKPRAELCPGCPILLRHVADALDTEDAHVMDLPIPCPQSPGVWKLPAMAVVKAVSGICPQITVLGPPECFVHIVPQDKQNKTHALRAALAFLLLMLGSALAITWFHADVNMAKAQQDYFRMITGTDAENPWMLAIPYAVGVFLGVSLFYAVLGKKKTVSPLEIKLEQYQQSAEKALGKNP